MSSLKIGFVSRFAMLRFVGTKIRLSLWSRVSWRTYNSDNDRCLALRTEARLFATNTEAELSPLIVAVTLRSIFSLLNISVSTFLNPKSSLLVFVNWISSHSNVEVEKVFWRPDVEWKRFALVCGLITSSFHPTSTRYAEPPNDFCSIFNAASLSLINRISRSWKALSDRRCAMWSLIYCR